MKKNILKCGIILAVLLTTNIVNAEENKTGTTGNIEFTYGDINQDGRMSAMDATLLNLHLLGRRPLTGKNLYSADLNSDGKITREEDAALLNDCLLGRQSKDDKCGTIERSEFTYGDINQDGKISVVDFARVRAHILGKRLLTGKELYSADVNADGEITEKDANLIRYYILGYKFGTTNYIEFTYGDINQDGRMSAMDATLLNLHLLGRKPLTGIELYSADLNADGKVTEEDAALLKDCILGRQSEYNKGGTVGSIKYMYGDINQDDEINSLDLVKIGSYVNGTKELTSIELYSADVNNDGSVNEKDLTLFKEYLANNND